MQSLRFHEAFAAVIYSGSHLLSHTVSSAVPSAVQGLTIVFGMGTGVSPGRITTRNVYIMSLVHGLALARFRFAPSRWCNPSYTSSCPRLRSPALKFPVGNLRLRHTSDFESKLSISCMPHPLQARFGLFLNVHSVLDNQTVKQPLLLLLERR